MPKKKRVKIPKKIKEAYGDKKVKVSRKNLPIKEEDVVARKSGGKVTYGPKGAKLKQAHQTMAKLQKKKRTSPSTQPPITAYIRSRLSEKIKKVMADSPGLSRKQAIGKAIGILRNEEKKK